MTAHVTAPITRAQSRSGFARWRTAALFRLSKPVLRSIQSVRADQYAAVGALPNAVVFLGDSITEGGLWSDWFPEARVSNRGTSGETTAQILARLDTAIDHATAVFVLAGTNDLSAGSSVREITDRLGHILDGIRMRAPKAAIFVQSVMPRKRVFLGEITALNLLLRELVAGREGVEFIDLWPTLQTTDGALRPEFTRDELHLNGAGYAAWAAVIRPLVPVAASGA